MLDNLIHFYNSVNNIEKSIDGVVKIIDLNGDDIYLFGVDIKERK